MTCDIVRRRYVGETLFAKHTHEQKWYYLSDMDEEDVVLIKVYDSNPEVEAKRKLVIFHLGFRLNHLLNQFRCTSGCVHASFELDDDHQLPPRESIELRVLVFTEA